MYFRFWFVNLINTYLRFKNSCFVEESFSLKCVLIEFAIPNLSLLYNCIPEVIIISVYFKIECMCEVNSQLLFCS